MKRKSERVHQTIRLFKNIYKVYPKDLTYGITGVLLNIFNFLDKNYKYV